ncbi:hypothetical protein JG688_00013494 [Phytophthora aleatoria]|uniref:Uncharacterized protein n=1 Tax=Phytophthora aleatoria TaxID=2496075 RepID=A0A8J5IHJ5_9STRA|nr:hypothetical protein JG688_00013494 [Phytophthora aleatoria]
MFSNAMYAARDRTKMYHPFLRTPRRRKPGVFMEQLRAVTKMKMKRSQPRRFRKQSAFRLPENSNVSRHRPRER